VSISLPEPDSATVKALGGALTGLRGVVIAGPDDTPGAPTAAARFAAAARWPILADPLSGLRAGDHDLTHVMAASDPLAWGGFLDSSGTEAVVRFGAVPTSKPMWEWLAANRGTPQVFIEPAGLRDPGRSASTVLRSDPAATLELLAGAIGATDADWLASWRSADAAAAAAVSDLIEKEAFPNEPMVARTVVGAMAGGSDLWVASSMPVRDLDAVMTPTIRDIRVLANRGANGIDGFVSTALGSAAVSGRTTVALAGDLSVIHDVGALATAKRLDIPLTLVVVDNNGGGIFHLLPQVGLADFERHWGTPHGLDLAAVARGFGVGATRVADAPDLASAVAAPSDVPRVIHVVTNRVENADLHRRIRSAVETALAGIA
jgi:2-succinyl-5-enolpyruvyl-6-hydroxy-3-cyclohexene-1-carboxylate synthase